MKTMILSLIGVVAFVGTAAWIAHAASGKPAGEASASAASRQRIDADTVGTIHDWLLAIPRRSSDMFVDTQAHLIAQADQAIRFHVVYSDDAGRLALARGVRALRPAALERVSFRRAARSVSPWVRDYYLPGRSIEGAPLAFLHAPDHYRGATGPWESFDPRDFVRAIPGLQAVQTALRAEGGGVVADRKRIFASSATLQVASERGEVRDPAQIKREMEAVLGRPVTWIETRGAAASAHCDLFLMPVGGDRVVLGSPRMGRSLLRRITPAERMRFLRRLRRFTSDGAGAPPRPEIPYGNILTFVDQDSGAPARVAAIAAVRRQMLGLGYACTEVPYLTLDPRRADLYLTITYTNVIMDIRGGRKIVYMPIYGLGALDRAAASAWKACGFDVIEIDALGPAVHGGAIRCLSQVTRKAP